MKIDPILPLQAALLLAPPHQGRLPCDTCPGRDLGICSPLDDSRLRQLLALGRPRRWAKGETVFVAGEPMGMFYKITSGIVAVYRALEDGRRQIVSINTVGDGCGYLEREGAYHFSGEAITDVEACGFDRRGFDGFVARHPDLGVAVAAELSDKLKRAAENLAMLGQLKAPEKVAYFLLQIGLIYADRLDANTTTLIPHLTRNQIADYLGLTLETVSRSFTKLKNRGLIALIGGDAIAILDRGKLARYAGLATI